MKDRCAKSNKNRPHRSIAQPAQRRPLLSELLLSEQELQEEKGRSAQHLGRVAAETTREMAARMGAERALAVERGALRRVVAEQLMARGGQTDSAKRRREAAEPAGGASAAPAAPPPAVRGGAAEQIPTKPPADDPPIPVGYGGADVLWFCGTLLATFLPVLSILVFLQRFCPFCEVWHPFGNAVARSANIGTLFVTFLLVL